MFVRPTQALVDDTALRHNLHALRDVSPSGRVLAVVKADAYGHGSARAGRVFLEAGAWGLAVSLIEEGIQLRQSGITSPIVVLGGIYPGYEDLALLHALSPVVWEAAQVDRLAAAVRRSGRRGATADVHLKIDTGMGRLGVLPEDVGDVLDAWRGLRAQIRLAGVMTHFACADEPVDHVSGRQLSRFDAVLASLSSQGLLDGALVHAANSAASLRLPAARYDMVRPGLALYGVEPGGCEGLFRGRPALSLISRISAFRRLPAGHGVSYGHRAVLDGDTLLAVVPVGYEDGYPRRATGQAEVLVRGRRCRVLGTITMDTVMVDVTAIEGVEVGDRVTLVGEQGEARILMEEVAEWAGTIPYEIMCGVSARVPRV